MGKDVRSLLVILLVASILCPACAGAEDSNWKEDFAAAKKQAAREKKDLLLDFTGSDWCGWCIKLDREVFSQERFLEEATKHFVLVINHLYWFHHPP